MPQFLHLLYPDFLFWGNTAEKELHKHRLGFVFLMHFKAKFSSLMLEKKTAWNFSFHWVKLFFDTMLPQQLTQNHIKRELMSRSLASKHTPPGHSNCCLCTFNSCLLIANFSSSGFVLQNFDSYFTFQILWLFLCNCSRKIHLPLLCRRISYVVCRRICCIHSKMDKTNQRLGCSF